MRCTRILTVAAGIASATAFGVTGASVVDLNARSLDSLKGGLEERKSAACPAVWTKVVADLKTMFLDNSTAQCNDDARAAIRVSLLFNVSYFLRH